MLVRVNTSLSVLSFSANLILTLLLPDKILSDVDPLTFMRFSLKSIISLLLLQTCISTILSTSQQLYPGLLIARSLGCQLSLSDVCSAYLFT